MNCVAVEIEILHPQRKTFGQTQTRAIQQASQQTLVGRHQAQHPLDFFLGQHHRNALALCRAAYLLHPWQFHTQDLPIHEKDGIERLPVCRG